MAATVEGIIPGHGIVFVIHGVGGPEVIRQIGPVIVCIAPVVVKVREGSGEGVIVDHAIDRPVDLDGISMGSTCSHMVVDCVVMDANFRQGGNISGPGIVQLESIGIAVQVEGETGQVEWFIRGRGRRSVSQDKVFRSYIGGDDRIGLPVPRQRDPLGNSKLSAPSGGPGGYGDGISRGGGSNSSGYMRVRATFCRMGIRARPGGDQ